MEPVGTADRRVTVRARNVGGIDEAEVQLEPGVNVLTGRNASNRTSLLQTVMAALGSDRATLRGSADEGRAVLEVGDETYTRTLERVDGEVVFGGSPYTDDPALADLFAFLLESNEARRAVARDDDLREIIMRPVDAEAVNEEVAALESRKREIESALDEREGLIEERDVLELRRDEVEGQLEAKRSTLESKQSAIEDASAELEESRERRAELEEELSALHDLRSTREDVRLRLGTERTTLDEHKDELREVRAALEEREEPSAGELETLEERQERFRQRKRALDSNVNQFQSLVEFNEAMLDGNDVVGRQLDDGSAADVTSRLLPSGETYRCWTCGQEATRGHVEETLDELRDRRTELVAARQSVASELDEVSSLVEEFAERERRHGELEQRREDLEAEVASTGERIDSLEDRLDDVAEEVGTVEAAVEEMREEAYDDVIELHKEANAVELEVEQLAAELAENEEALASTRARLETLDDLEEERSRVAEELRSARTRIERLEDVAVATFNDHMEDVLEVLDYAGVERIWIERTEETVREGRGTVRRGVFDLHVVRSTEDGTVYEDEVAHLSESEREVTGLVFALAGFLAHDLHETMPFVLLDSIEAIDSDRIAALVEYLAEYVPYLVVALLPEDAGPVDDRHHEITTI